MSACDMETTPQRQTQLMNTTSLMCKRIPEPAKCGPSVAGLAFLPLGRSALACTASMGSRRPHSSPCTPHTERVSIALTHRQRNRCFCRALSRLLKHLKPASYAMACRPPMRMAVWWCCFVARGVGSSATAPKLLVCREVMLDATMVPSRHDAAPSL